MSETIPIVHIVDDDASFLTAISRLLRANGFSVKTHSSAHEFLAVTQIRPAVCWQICRCPK
jgi:FixJ family two-component response regulator